MFPLAWRCISLNPIKIMLMNSFSFILYKDFLNLFQEELRKQVHVLFMVFAKQMGIFVMNNAIEIYSLSK